MKFLVLMNQLLYPADTGGKIRSSQLFERLHRDHDVTIAVYLRHTESREQAELMRACCRRLELVPWVETPKFSPRFYLEIAAGLGSPRPYIVDKYYRPEMVAKLRELLDEQDYDVLLCDFLQPSRNVLELDFQPKILFQHNVEAVIRQRHAEQARNAVAAWFLRHQWQRLQRYEGQASQAFDHCIMVSDKDCATMREAYGVETTSAVPLGVDVDYYQPGDEPVTPGRLVFTGSMDWLPNEDAVVWFRDEVMPFLGREHPEASLSIVGRRPTPKVQSLAGERVIVTGTVDDIRPHVAAAEVYVVPLRIGGGTRIKIFEAMAMGKAVVSTTLGAEGLPVEEGVDILLADEPETFAAAVARLLNDEALRDRLGAAARRKVAEKYSWDAAAEVFAGICREVAERVRRP